MARENLLTPAVVAALKRLGGIGHLDEIHAECAAVRRGVLKPMVLHELRAGSPDAATGRLPSDADLFYSVGGSGGAHRFWGLRHFLPQAPASYPIRDVSRAHAVLLERGQTTLYNVRGIAYRDGRVLGVQVGFARSNDYPDTLNDDGTIDHIGEGFDREQISVGGNSGMLDAHRDGLEIPVFQAVGPRGNKRYADLGLYRVKSWRKEQRRLKNNAFETDAYVFTLEPTTTIAGNALISDGEANALAEESASPPLSREGRKQLRTHLSAERNPGNRDMVLRLRGVTCEACGFNFGDRYGTELDGFIEVHHTRPVAVGEYTPTIDDFAVLCANCHRASHKGRVLNPRSVEELRVLIRNHDG